MKNFEIVIRYDDIGNKFKENVGENDEIFVMEIFVQVLRMFIWVS